MQMLTLVRLTNLVVPEFWFHVTAKITKRVVLVLDLVRRELCTTQHRCIDPTKLLLPLVHEKEKNRWHADRESHDQQYRKNVDQIVLRTVAEQVVVFLVELV
jgi:hypothetical protein